MWTRAELKRRAKQHLRHYYGPAVFVSFIANMFTSKSGGSSGGAAAGWNTGAELSTNLGAGAVLNESEQLEELLEGLPSSLEQIVDSLLNPAALGLIASILLISLVISLVLNVFVAPLFMVGKNRYYMESRACDRSAGTMELLWGFTHNYLNIVWTMFLKNLIIFLGTFFFVIPGIYFSYCYHMVPYILAENPDMRAGDVLRMSKDMMEGHKLNTFVLGMSFVGWWIAGALCFGVGTILVRPYYDATFAELYARLRTPYERYLNGFGKGGYDYDAQQHVPFTERNETAGAGQEPTGQRDAESSRNTDYGYYQGTETGTWRQDQTVAPQSQERGNRPEVEPCEPGEKRGYYLNGVFYPYTEEELRELEANKHKN